VACPLFRFLKNPGFHEFWESGKDVLWILKQNPGSSIAVAANFAHVAKCDLATWPSEGLKSRVKSGPDVGSFCRKYLIVKTFVFESEK
jgi:hypothetical protein